MVGLVYTVGMQTVRLGKYRAVGSERQGKPYVSRLELGFI